MSNSDEEEENIRIVKLDPGQLNKDALERNFMIIVRSSQIFLVIGVVIIGAFSFLIWKVNQYPSTPDELVNVMMAIMSLFLISGLILVLVGGNSVFVTTQVSRAIGNALFAVPEIPRHFIPDQINLYPKDVDPKTVEYHLKPKEEEKEKEDENEKKEEEPKKPRQRKMKMNKE